MFRSPLTEYQKTEKSHADTFVQDILFIKHTLGNPLTHPGMNENDVLAITESDYPAKDQQQAWHRHVQLFAGPSYPESKNADCLPADQIFPSTHS